MESNQIELHRNKLKTPQEDPSRRTMNRACAPARAQDDSSACGDEDGGRLGARAARGVGESRGRRGKLRGLSGSRLFFN
jgi:hypothetical protein